MDMKNIEWIWKTSNGYEKHRMDMKNIERIWKTSNGYEIHRMDMKYIEWIWKTYISTWYDISHNRSKYYNI